jgi:hypothetical protein
VTIAQLAAALAFAAPAVVGLVLARQRSIAVGVLRQSALRGDVPLLLQRTTW